MVDSGKLKPLMNTQANFVYEHPWGSIYGWFSPCGLQYLTLPHAETGGPRRSVLHSSANDGHIWALQAALERYFAGQREQFDGIPLDLGEGTSFQQEVWVAARSVPWGATTTYGELARRLGRGPGSARAVGRALGENPLAVIVPCHRFLGADGSLQGYAAGLAWKQELLRIEGALLG